MTNGVEDPAKGMAIIRQEAQRIHGISLPRDVVAALYRGDTVTI